MDDLKQNLLRALETDVKNLRDRAKGLRKLLEENQDDKDFLLSLSENLDYSANSVEKQLATIRKKWNL